MKNYIFVVFLFVKTFSLFANEKFSVSMFEPLTFDLTASTEPCKDASGNICALIKAYIPSIKEAIFEGNVVKSTYNSGEYLVYVQAGTQNIKVSHPTFGNIDISVSEHGISLESKMTYRLILNLKGNEMMRENCGNLKVVASADFSNVLLDGMYVGQTPLYLKNIKEGKHILSIGEYFETEINIQRGKDNLCKFKINDIDDDLIVFQDENGLYGVKDSEEEIVIPAKYEYLSDDEGGGTLNTFIAGKNGKYGLLSKDGREVLPLIYDGFDVDVDTGGDSGEVADKSFYVIGKDGKVGCVNTYTGKITLPVEYNYIQGFVDGSRGRYCAVEKGDDTYIIDRTGSVIVKDIEQYSISNPDEQYIAIKRNGKWGFVDSTRDGKPVTEFIYDDVDDLIATNIHDSSEITYIDPQTHLTLVKIENNDDTETIGFANSEGKIIIPAIFYGFGYFEAENYFHDGLCFLGINNKYAIFDEYGNQLTKFIYIDFQEFLNGIAYAKTENGEWIKLKSSDILKNKR